MLIITIIALLLGLALTSKLIKVSDKRKAQAHTQRKHRLDALVQANTRAYVDACASARRRWAD